MSKRERDRCCGERPSTPSLGTHRKEGGGWCFTLRIKDTYREEIEFPWAESCSWKISLEHREIRNLEKGNVRESNLGAQDCH